MSNILIYGLGSVGVFGLLYFILNKVINSDKKNLLNIFKHEQKQVDIEEDIKTITKEQEVIVKQIKASEQASEKSKTEVKKVLRESAVKIQEILKKDTIEAIDKDIDLDWDKL